MEGTRVGNYSITHRLAEGGMGAVYVAHHELMGREAVVKVLLPNLSQNKEMVTRFFNEARAASSIHHPGIVEVFDMGYLPDGRAYLVMEKLRGEALSARLARGRVRQTEAVAIVRQLAGALQAAHAMGIVHRDLKPDNLFVIPDPEVQGGERVKVLDFGIAKLAADKRGSLMTAAGSIFGTPAYMAPEQCNSTASVDHRADLYAVGCILYELLCGAPPFGQGGLELLAAHLRDQPAPVRSVNGQIAPALDAVVMRLLAKAPEQRFQSCNELIAALDALPALETSASPIAFAPTMPPAEAIAAVASSPRIAPTTHGAAAGERSVAPEAARSGRLVPAVAVLGLLVVGGGVFAYTQLGGDAPQPETPTEVAAAEPDPALPPPAPSPGAAAIAEARAAIAREDWSGAIAAASTAIGLEPDSGDARELRDQAEAEIVHRAVFEKLEAAAQKAQAATVAQLWTELPPTSLYRSRAEPLYQQVRDAWMKPHLDKAERYAKAGRCSSITAIVTEVAKTFPDGAAVIEAIASACQAPTKSAGGKETSPAPKPTPTPKPCDEVSCLLDPSMACCKQYKPRPLPPTPDPVAETLSRNDITAGVAKVRGRLDACGRAAAPVTGTVKVKVKVEPSGAVGSVSVDSAPAAEVGNCVAAAMRSATFRRSQRGGTFTYPVMIR